MKVLVVGTGSIGRRHIANLQQLGADVLAYSHRRKGSSLEAAEPVPGVTFVADVEQALEQDVDAVVVANRTDLHVKTALQAARRGKAVFVEKPLSVSLAGTQELVELERSRGLVIEAGFMLRFHPNLRWIKQFLEQDGIGELMYLRAAVGQWLPDWRPGTDHRDGYGSRREFGGGAILDLIHELDLVTWLGGPASDVCAMTRHVKTLEIGTEAVAQVGLRLAGDTLAQVHLDYVRPAYGRALEVVGERGVLSWDYSQGTVTLSRSQGAAQVAHRVADGFERNGMFHHHMRHFLQRLSEPDALAASPLEDAIAVQRVALACHLSAIERRHIRPSDIPFDDEPRDSL